jgi:hypothetical protein
VVRTGAGDTPAPDGFSDIRLMLQLGMLFFLLYLVFLCVWFWATRHLRAAGAGLGLGVAAERLRDWWAERVARPGRSAGAPASRETFTPAGPIPQWSCEIAWQPGQLQFQAVISPHSASTAERVEDDQSSRWPNRMNKPSPRELESALASLAVSIAAAGWEPVHSSGARSERRFVWRQEGEPSGTLNLVGRAPTAATAPRDIAAKADPVADADASRTGRARAPRGAKRDAVLRAVAAQPDMTMRELALASGVKPNSLPPLLRTLTRLGELEKITRADGMTGYALARTVSDHRDAALEPAAGGERPQ